MAEIENEEQASTWAKFPWQKTIIVLLSAISLLFGTLIKNYSDSDASKQEQINAAAKVNFDLKTDIKELTRQLNASKDDQLYFLRKQDSTNRAALERPAKELLNAIRK